MQNPGTEATAPGVRTRRTSLKSGIASNTSKIMRGVNGYIDSHWVFHHRARRCVERDIQLRVKFQGRSFFRLVAEIGNPTNKRHI